MLCMFLAMLSLAESSPHPPPTPPLADVLAAARMAEREAIAQVLAEVVRINPASAVSTRGEWLADLRGFDGQERQELSDLWQKEGVALGDRSKLRRLATRAAQSTAKVKFTGLVQSSQVCPHILIQNPC
jgi:hypothetical protein